MLQQQPFALSPEEHQAIASSLESSKKIITQITSSLKRRLPFDQQIVIRAGELEAAIQRLEWQLERELGTVAHPDRSSSPALRNARAAGA